ncbi:ATP F0F1 synthase synthase [Nocardioides sp. Bht2]|uniref:ATP F0F1 synthase synthase n=1 Tax=Nocardioides sp. Bht2 TaxID=3392297 RepID=UPI0039B6AC81
MDNVYAKLKRLRRDPIRKVASDARLYTPLDIAVDSTIEYSSATTLSEDEWFGVPHFSARDYYPNFMPAGTMSADYANLTRTEFDDINVLISAQDGAYYFQRVRPAAFMRKKTVTFGDVAIIDTSSRRIIVNDLPDAAYFPAADTLVFRDLASISGLFQGIDTLYKEATEEQVEEFLGMDFVATEGFDSKSVSKPNRKRIALALSTLANLPTEDRSKLVQYTNKYLNGRLKFDESENCFTVSNDDDLKLLVYGIEQRFYTTEIGAEKRLANSIIAI